LAGSPAKVWGVVFASASLGLPPLYIVSIVAGMLRLAVVPYLAIATAGRGLRFAVVVLAPQVFGLR
jgi:membrane protein YqaA with SNARE-associated domain